MSSTPSIPSLWHWEPYTKHFLHGEVPSTGKVNAGAISLLYIQIRGVKLTHFASQEEMEDMVFRRFRQCGSIVSFMTTIQQDSSRAVITISYQDCVSVLRAWAVDGEAYFGTTSQAKYAMRGAETYNITQRVFTKWEKGDYEQYQAFRAWNISSCTTAERIALRVGYVGTNERAETAPPEQLIDGVDLFESVALAMRTAWPSCGLSYTEPEGASDELPAATDEIFRRHYYQRSPETIQTSNTVYQNQIARETRYLRLPPWEIASNISLSPSAMRYFVDSAYGQHHPWEPAFTTDAALVPVGVQSVLLTIPMSALEQVGLDSATLDLPSTSIFEDYATVDAQEAYLMRSRMVKAMNGKLVKPAVPPTGQDKVENGRWMGAGYEPQTVNDVEVPDFNKGSYDSENGEEEDDDEARDDELDRNAQGYDAFASGERERQ